MKWVLYGIAVLCFAAFWFVIEDTPEWQLTILHETALLLILLSGIIALGLAVVAGKLDVLIKLRREQVQSGTGMLPREDFGLDVDDFD